MECTAFDAALQKPVSIGGRELDGLYDDWCMFSYPFNLTGQPALSAPIPRAHHDLPIGLQIVGAQGKDHLVLALARAWDEATAAERSAPPTPALSAPTDPGGSLALDLAIEHGRSRAFATEASALRPGATIRTRRGNLVRIVKVRRLDKRAEIEFEHV